LKKTNVKVRRCKGEQEGSGHIRSSLQIPDGKMSFLWMNDNFQAPVPVPGSQEKTFNRFI
jgi:hypothetical protein